MASKRTGVGSFAIKSKMKIKWTDRVLPVLYPHWKKTGNTQRSKSCWLFSVLLKAAIINIFQLWSIKTSWPESPWRYFNRPLNSPPDPPHCLKGPVWRPVPLVLWARQAWRALRPLGLRITALLLHQTLRSQRVSSEPRYNRNQHTGLGTILFIMFTLFNKTAWFGSEVVCDNFAYSEF